MDIKITKGGENKVFDPRGISQSKKEDFKAIKLNKDGKIYVEHILMADRLIKDKKAVEAKGVDFEIGDAHVKFISDVKEN